MVKKFKNFKKTTTVAAVGLSALLLLAGCSAADTSNSNSSDTSQNEVQELLVPSLATAFGGFAVSPNGAAIPASEASNATRVEMIFDFHCPACKMIEGNSAETFKNLVDNDEAQFFLTPVSFLDERGSTDDYSSRAASALAEIAESSPEHFFDFFQAVMAAQPNNGAGYEKTPNQFFIDIAEEVGVPADAAKKIEEERYKAWVIENTAVVSARSDILPAGLSTPAIFVGGEMDGVTLSGFEQVTFSDSDTDATFVEVFERVAAGS